jgi:hypothetical protein
MKTFGLFVGAALVAGVLADAPRQLSSAERFARRRAARAVARSSTQPLQVVDGLDAETAAELAELKNASHVEYSSNWAGAVLESPPSGTTFKTAKGTFTVPDVAKGTGSASYWAASAWVGIDGDTYQNAILQAGVDFEITSSGSKSFDAWYEYYPDYAYEFSGLSISEGDVISVSITVSSSTKGVVVVDNESTGVSKTKTLSAPEATASLGGQNAEWIVEDFLSGSSMVPFADFNTVTFTGAEATTASGSTVDLDDAIIIDIKSGNTVYTDCEIDSSTSVSCTYL